MALRPFVECCWSHDSCVSPVQPAQRRVLPDGCIDLLWVDDGQEPELQLVGAMTRARIFEFAGPNRLVGVRFRPAGAAALLSVQARDLQDQILPLAEADRAGKQLSGSLGGDGPTVERLLERFLLERLPAVPSAALGYARFFASLPADGRDWSRLSGYSDRQLRRVFDRWVGLAPRQFRRIVRLRRLLDSLPARESLADVATRAGYCDQPHMNRDVVRLTGVSPGRLMAETSNPTNRRPE